jgi:tetratricopeptide (TPR) repeat protein
MGNTLPSNPTRADYITYAEKIEKSNPERAIEIYSDIVCDLRLQKNLVEAVGIMLKIVKLQVEEEKAVSLKDTARLYKKIGDKNLYIKYLQEAIIVYQSFGGFLNCGKYSALIAEEYEDDFDFKNAIDYYARTVDYYEMAEDAELKSTRYTIKLALLSALDPSLTENAIIMFENVAKRYTKNKLTIYSAPESLFRAGICRLLTNDLEEAKKHIREYSIDYPIFSTRSEAKFLNMLCDALEERDVNAFTAILVDYNAAWTIDYWATQMLFSIKKTIYADCLC